MKDKQCTTGSQLNTLSYCEMKTMASPNSPVNMFPRITTVNFPADELPRPAVIGLGGNCGSYPDSTTAIKEILASVLNLSNGIKSKIIINTDYQDSDEENSEDSSCSSDLDNDSDCVPLITCAQNDIRFNRSKASWETPLSVSLNTKEPPISLGHMKDALKTRTRDSSPQPVCEVCTEVALTGPVVTSQMNFPLTCFQRDLRRFSTPNLSNYSLNSDDTLSRVTSEVLTLPLRAETSDSVLYKAEDAKSSCRRSQSYSNIHNASEKTLTASTETTLNAAEKVFEPTVNLENENAHFLVADLLISVVEKMKSSLQCSQWELYNEDWCGSQHLQDNADRGHVQRFQWDQCDMGHIPPTTSEQWNGGGGTAYRQWCKQDHVAIPIARHKNYSESAASVDSGYEGLAAMQQNSPTDPIVGENLSKDSAVSEDDDFDEFVIIELEDYERINNSNTPQSCKMHERTLTQASNSAEQIAKKLYKAFRTQWLQTDVPISTWPSISIEQIIKNAIPEEFESSLCLLNEIKKFKMKEASDWSPLRFQVISTLHHPLKRDAVIAAQHYVCAGCGTQVEPRYTSRLRYCDYFGKYFCDCCHSYAESSIPARIILKWNFSKYYVSNFAKTLLDSIWQSHKFNVKSENSELYKKARDLNRVKELQEQLIYIKRLLATCRFAESVLKDFEKVPSHLTEELHHFTLSELVGIKQNMLLPALRELLNTSTAHVDKCELCQAKGFICEFCHGADILFPFQTDICRRCEVCKTCYHKQCFKTDDCPKCRRIEARKAVKNVLPVSEGDEEEFSPLVLCSA
ncbi:protein associated with UVRAG as autophagy enhancer isoform X2 [Bombina bombina]|uniref:protein associated with UVRAG as autophagy enhancer isoform X2 n=2 Tax=Bombina bombina TaxID=8345 RepID=UPI00235AF616|nr:protein associated with UVRAG as autophagy enhancer isoform X2 [Bombina bombina]